jgi:uncharacterized membrane protein
MEVSKMAIKWLSLILLGLLFLFGGGIGWVGSREMSVPMYVYWHLIFVVLFIYFAILQQWRYKDGKETWGVACKKQGTIINECCWSSC